MPLLSIADVFDQVDAIAEAVSDIGGGSVLGRSNVYTYRTPSYMLSSTQVITNMIHNFVHLDCL